MSSGKPNNIEGDIYYNGILLSAIFSALAVSSGSPSGTGMPLQVRIGTFTSTELKASATFVNTSLNVSITPRAVTSKILLLGLAYVDVAATEVGFFQFVRGATPIGIGDTSGLKTSAGGALTNPNTTSVLPIPLIWVDSPSTITATTYTLQCKSSSGGNIAINSSLTDSDTAAFPRCVSVLVAIELQ